MTRQTKSARQRAEEALGVAERNIERLTEKCSRLRDELDAAEAEHGKAERRRDYLAANPDLPQEPTPDDAESITINTPTDAE